MAYADHNDEQSLPKKVGGWLLFAAGFGFSKFVGATFLVPFACSALALFLLRKFRSDPSSLTVTLALALGHVSWFVAGAILMPALLGQVGLDILIISALVAWTLLRVSIAPVALLMAYELFSLVVNGVALSEAPTMSLPFRALLVHILWHLLTIGFGVAYLAFGRTPKDSQDADGAEFY